MVATWDDTESESEEENDAAHMCFMAHGDDATKVTFENSLEEDDLTMDELAHFFEELQHRYEISQSHNKKLKRKNDTLKNKIDIVVKEKDDLTKATKGKPPLHLVTKMNFWKFKNGLMF